MEFFVEIDSIVRKIWGKSDTILFIFAGASAEFALNKAVDWLYFTGRLPQDPIGRLFSTVSYARHIVFAEKESALRAIDKMGQIHSQLELNRGYKIPDWAYRDVLFMLIYYSIASFELLERKLSDSEKYEVFTVFRNVGERMGLKDLPDTFEDWKTMRNDHLNKDLEKNNYTVHLYEQYKKHLGAIRYALLKEVQILIAPEQVIQMLSLRKRSPLLLFVPLYKLSRKIKTDIIIKELLLPSEYKSRIKELDVVVE
ncbi:MAG: oxygenase MpaB family protein [Flavisolibacter sp.]